MNNYTDMTNEQLLIALDRASKLSCSASSPIAIGAEKTRAIIVKECHRRNLIGYKSGRKFREAY